MKKVLLGFIVLICIIISYVSIINNTSQTEIRNKETFSKINFQLNESFLIDISGVYQWCFSGQFDYDLPFTFFYQFNSYEELESLFKEFGLEMLTDKFSSEDFESNYVAISIGRELSDVSYVYRQGDSQPFSEVTFSEEYKKDEMFVYYMDKKSIYPSDISYDHNAFYIIHDNERIYYGDNILELNK